MTNQEKAIEIRDTMRALERNQKRGVELSAKLHKLLDEAARAQCETLGLDTVALSAGGNK